MNVRLGSYGRFTATTVLAATVDSSLASLPQRPHEPSPIFAPIIEDLKSRSKVPLRLPAKMEFESGDEKLIPTILEARTERYEIILGWVEDCNGGNACRYGTLTGERIFQNRRLNGKKVKLSNGIVGFFEKSGCGANCSDATIAWIEKGYVYSVGIKAAELKELRELALSCLGAAQTPK